MEQATDSTNKKQGLGEKQILIGQIAGRINLKAEKGH
jgi:hypothetical protein